MPSPKVRLKNVNPSPNDKCSNTSQHDQTRCLNGKTIVWSYLITQHFPFGQGLKTSRSLSVAWLSPSQRDVNKRRVRVRVHACQVRERASARPKTVAYKSRIKYPQYVYMGRRWVISFSTSFRTLPVIQLQFLSTPDSASSLLDAHS